MVKREKAGSPWDAWKVAVYNTMRYGKLVKDERGQSTRELLNLVMEIADPLLVVQEHPYWKGMKLDDYTSQLLNPQDKGFVYDYGNRFRGHFLDEETKESIDQIEDVVIPRLEENPNTRRAIMTTYDPCLDYHRDEIPCIIAVDFKIREDRLFTSAFWRSNDIYGAYYPNIMGIGKISEYVAKALDVWVGPLVTHAASAHIYETDFTGASDIARRGNPHYMK